MSRGSRPCLRVRQDVVTLARVALHASHLSFRTSVVLWYSNRMGIIIPRAKWYDDILNALWFHGQGKVGSVRKNTTCEFLFLELAESIPHIA